MLTTLSRIIKYGLQAFLRNGWLSAATISVMVLALLVFQGLMLFNVLTSEAIISLQDKIDIAVYFKSNVPEDNILKLENVLAKMSEVKSVEYVSKDKALEVFKEKHQGDETISKALAELGENPLLASINIKAKDPREYSAIASYLENENLASAIEKVTYNQNRTAIDKLARIVGIFEKAGWALTIFLTLTAILVTFNTVRLVIYSTREEIGIMRLVGASNIFINGPHIVGGLIYGLIAAAVSFIIAAPIVVMAAPYASVLIPEMDLQAYFYDHMLGLAGYQLLFGAFLGAVSSVLAVRRYLKI